MRKQKAKGKKICLASSFPSNQLMLGQNIQMIRFTSEGLRDTVWYRIQRLT